jgi:hypothetical protein
MGTLCRDRHGCAQKAGRLIEFELSIRGILRGFGLKVGQVTRKGFDARIRELVTQPICGAGMIKENHEMRLG